MQNLQQEIAVASNTCELDLSSIRGFIAAAEWMRRNLLLAKPSAAMLQLDVLLSKGNSADKSRVSIFWDTSDAYVIGFRGKDGAFVLKDAGQAAIAKLRQAGLIGRNESPQVLNGIETGHRSLQTFEAHDGPTGMKGRSYCLADLQNAARLAEFADDHGPVTLDDVRRALSILVCMIAESARSNLVLRDFERVYYGEHVTANDVVQYYDKARRITAYANAFPNPVLTDRIEKLEKRAAELATLWASIQDQAHAGKKEFFRLAITGAAPQKPPNVANAATRIREIAHELKASAPDLCEILSLCSKPTALRAARYGVVAPIPR